MLGSYKIKYKSVPRFSLNGKIVLKQYLDTEEKGSRRKLGESKILIAATRACQNPLYPVIDGRYPIHPQDTCLQWLLTDKMLACHGHTGAFFTNFRSFDSSTSFLTCLADIIFTMHMEGNSFNSDYPRRRHQDSTGVLPELLTHI
ncbi:hypothetical protein NC652_034179 [Populus alba x Populus x berolinensis]|nr:hypothetical protein NC652_034179 [Populus alba x Populus x berolinensis]